MGRKLTGAKPKLATLRQRRWRRKRKAAEERAKRQVRTLDHAEDAGLPVSRARSTAMGEA